MSDPRPHVVIVGAGFGGLRAARALAGAPVRVTLLDRHNYHLFQPLLYQVATCGLSPGDIARPVRAILRRQRNLEFRMTEVREIDFAARRLDTATGPVGYDYLILAVGGRTSWFGLEGVASRGFPLKDIPDAIAIRNQVLGCFELGVQESVADVRRSMLTFAVVGGGPTGVEVAGILSELCRLVLAKDLPELDVKDVRILLLEATDRLLPGMPHKLQEATAEILWRKHVEVRFGARVVDYDGEKVRLSGGEIIPSRTLIWAAGVRACELVERLGLAQGALGRLRVLPTLQVPERPEVFAIGDAALLEAAGAPLPMMAPVAIQQGRLAAANVLRAIRGEPQQAFRYRDPGQLATIGRNAAVAHIRGLAFRGFPAWVVWLVVHLVQLIGFRNRLVVLVSWAWDYFLYDRAVRLITAPVRDACAGDG
jgi:NADH dehydrogenase